MAIAELRRAYHQKICQEIIRVEPNKEGTLQLPNFADGRNRSSIAIAHGVLRRMECSPSSGKLSGKDAEERFASITGEFLEKALALLQHLRPGDWVYSTQTSISDFDQYEHLIPFTQIIRESALLASSVGVRHIISTDIAIGRLPVSDDAINQDGLIVDETTSLCKLTPLRAANVSHPILHASISCKWTLRSDRSQNARTEALNLIRNRKGRTPHIVAVTAEPLPTRLAALALGTGDLDCVYHFALPELQAAIADIDNQDQGDMLDTLIAGRRLRDISDLPFDLAV